MSFKKKFTLILASASLAIYTIAGAWLATRAQQPANDPGAQQRIFESVLQHIQNDYVDEPNMEKVRAGALRGLAGQPPALLSAARACGSRAFAL